MWQQDARFAFGSSRDAFGSQSFGEVGPYVWWRGTAHGRLNPGDPRNAAIVNVECAPREADGCVLYECPVEILAPRDRSKGNGALLYDVLNRGNKVALHAFNDAPRTGVVPPAMSVNAPASPADAGNGFLMRRGFTVVWSGWQGVGVAEGQGLMAARLPVGTHEGAPLTAQSREEWVFDHGQDPALGALSYPTATDDQEKCALTVRQRERDSRTAIPPEAWRFVSDRAIEIDRPAGFDAGAIYEFIYPARDPVVSGLGLAAIRDVVSFLRHGEEDAAGEANPLCGAINRALAFGLSQAGRVLRDFLYEGFNEDLGGRQVFDGMIPSMAGARRSFTNHAFAQPGRFARQHEDRLFPHDQFPFSYAETADPVSGRTDGLLSRCAASGTCPKVIQTETSSDFFHGRASLLVTNGRGAAVPIPETVRLYHLAGVQHGGGSATAGFARNFPVARHWLNPADVGEIHRALLLALDLWAAGGPPPPPSRFPGLEEGTLVAADRESYGFPIVPDVDYPGKVNGLSVLDNSKQPPRPIEGCEYEILVPAIDQDGNEVSGVRVPEVAVPLGTYTGWAPRAPGYAEGELFALGAFLPFAGTRADREAAGDPRPSVAERYRDGDDYVRRTEAVARQLCAHGLLLEEDIERVVAEARARWVAL